MTSFVRKHFFCFSFIGDSMEESKPSVASVYVGYFGKKITFKKIEEAKESAGVNPGACLIAVSYLGKMRKSEFQGK